MKNLLKLTPLFCLSLFLSLVMFGISGLNAEVIKSFPESDFWIVDHTTPSYSSATFPQDTVVGYKFIVDTSSQRVGYYQLTDTIPNMTIAIWNKNKIDLNQSWEFDLRLFFGSGSYDNNSWIPHGSMRRRVSEGMCFALHYKDAPQNLIGVGLYGIGYSGIRPSLAVEFDTEHNESEGIGAEADYNSNTSNHHISYLNGSTFALPGTYKPMQNNWANVGIGDWFDVKIVWRKGYNENSAPYYDLLTYMREGPNTNNGPLLLRDSLRFNNLSEVIEGLEVDSNCQALVTWGVTSATCGIANRHAVEFVKLETKETLPPAITALLVSNCVREGFDLPPHPVVQTPQYNAESPKLLFPIYYIYYDTIPHELTISDCGPALQADDTVEYSISCTEVWHNHKCNYWLSLSGIPPDADIKYYLNDVLVTDSSFYATNSVWNNLYFLSLQYPFDGNNNTVSNAKITINGAEYNFKFTVEDADCAEGCDAVTIAPPPSQPREGTGNSILSNDFISHPTIQLGERDIHYVVKTTSNSGSSITTAFINEIPSPKLMQNSSVTRLDDTSYSVTAKFNGREWSDDSTTFEICATLSNGTTCCDTFRMFISAMYFYNLHAYQSSIPGILNYKILDTNALLAPAVPKLNVEVYDDFGNYLRTLHNEVPVSPEGTIYYGDLPMPLNNIVFQWGDKIVTVRVVKISK